jgi:hypothetical protein
MWFGTLAFCVALPSLGALQADDQAETKAAIDKAIKAMGGEAKLAKLQTGGAKGKATAQVDGQELTATLDASWQGLGQYRVESEALLNGMNIKATLVLNGDQGWLKHNDRTEDPPPGVLPFIQNLFYALRMPQMLPALKDKSFQLSPLGEVKVGDRPALGVLVVHKDRKDVRLLFDKETALPVKSEIGVTDPQGKEVTIEYWYSDYKELGGLKHPGKITIKGDGKEFAIEVSEVKALDKLEDSFFAKP